MRLTGGLAGDRDPAAPLLTLYDGPARVELSGATVENWVCKTANLLVDGHGAPDRVGLLLPLHWQAVCFLLGSAATGATVAVASTPSALAGCAVAFVSADRAEAALDAGVEDVLVASGHPLGTRLPAVPALCLDAAVEVPGYGDRFVGSAPAGTTVLLDGAPVSAPDLGLGRDDRVLTTLAPSDQEGLGVLLAALAAGASLVLLVDGDATAVAATERVTATAGVHVPGARQL
ncbi:MAG TPA: TIGR03089 family protein [Mycobacteriales bacterium]|nr:TIGR03089 family protein [Mycobacteriales bacterium]